MTGPLPRFRCVMLRRSGATDIRIVRAEDAAAARAALTAAGLDPVSVEPVGPSLLNSLGTRVAAGNWRLPALPALPSLRAARLSPALFTAAVIVAAASVAVAIGAWGLAALDHVQAARIARDRAAALAAYPRIAAIERARPRAAAIMAAPTIGAIAARLRSALPEDAGLVSLLRDESGAMTIEVETPDPDRLRTARAADPLLAGFREAGQTMTDGGTMMVILQGRAR